MVTWRVRQQNHAFVSALYVIITVGSVSDSSFLVLWNQEVRIRLKCLHGREI